MNIDLPPQYDPKSVESRIYAKWQEAGAFHAVPDGRPPEQRFSVVIPPPNVTGALHLGHAINGTIQDILVRYHRMRGDNTLWMPGIDHAGIATQAVVEKTIFEKEKKNRHDLGRDELVRRIWEWKEKFGDRILNQLQSIGSSCDWERTRFTLDEVCARAVREAFFKMFKDGLIFRGKRLVNWDTHLQTAVADDEIYHETVRGQMTSIRYPVEMERTEDSGLRTENQDTQSSSLSPQSYLIVATTRPETMLGDTAVAVHPDDPRYKHLHGKFVIVPLVGRRIPIIADGLLVDPKFGTGVVKVTPAHDPNDYATGQRHNLEQINLLTADGKVNENGRGTFAGKEFNYTGLKFATAARKQVLADLESLGLIAEAKPHEHEVGHSDRSKTPIEPFLSDQWFVRMGDVEETKPSTLQPSETRPSGSVPPPPHSNALAYFISFHTYATWLHGEEKGSVDPANNAPGTDFIPPDLHLLQRDAANMVAPPFELSLDHRRSVLRTIQEVAAHRGWTLHAVNVRSNHVHAVVAGNHAPERMMNDFKSWATRRMRESGLITDETKVWSRHGSTPYLWKQKDVAEAADYVLHKQGPNQPGTFLPDNSAQTLPNGRVSDVAVRSETQSLGSAGGITLANGTRASGLAQAAMDAVTDGRVKITPERYAKGYLDWLGQKRDWCISRQLWWGHRIPVWYRKLDNPDDPASKELMQFTWRILRWRDEGRLAISVEYSEVPDPNDPGADVLTGDFVCIRSADDVEVITALETSGYTQDPDVLDTWFSSALWPISTMGWPNSDSTSETRPLGSVSPPHAQTLPNGRVSDGMPPEPELLSYFYPTSVLSTAREILTLWVARMVMFGLYCDGDVPFKNVYIHAVIQDGEGRPMKKSLGNGVDPVDIVASHGADALRFTLASMATETQDIRMPVVKDAKTGVNTSPKFDIGRNFANKIWNASRFILGNIDEDSPAITEPSGSAAGSSALEDRWILSRLNATITSTTAAINDYRFADLANGLYQFFWSDLCDWYLEIAKARIKGGDATVQSILLHCLRTSLQLLHPLMPFITEELWSKLPHTPAAPSSPGIAIPGLTSALLITAPFPQANPALYDAAAESQITIVLQITTAIREIQNRYPAAKGKDAVIAPRTAELQAVIENSRAIIEPLAGIKLAQIAVGAQKPENAATAVLTDAQVFIAGVIDKAAESARLAKRRDELNKFIAGNKAKLSNDAFTAKAPEKVVQGLRDQLQQQETELATVEKNLAELV